MDSKYDKLIALVTNLVAKHKPEKVADIPGYKETLEKYEAVVVAMPILSILDQMLSKLDIQKKDVDRADLRNILRELDFVTRMAG